MQLICFSDLKQSSITNYFALIYQLSMRKILWRVSLILKEAHSEIKQHSQCSSDQCKHKLTTLSILHQRSFLLAEECAGVFLRGEAALIYAAA